MSCTRENLELVPAIQAFIKFYLNYYVTFHFLLWVLKTIFIFCSLFLPWEKKNLFFIVTSYKKHNCFFLLIAIKKGNKFSVTSDVILLSWDQWIVIEVFWNTVTILKYCNSIARKSHSLHQIVPEVKPYRFQYGSVSKLGGLKNLLNVIGVSKDSWNSGTSSALIFC